MAAVQYRLSRCVRNGPSQKTPEELRKLEKGFVLDNIAVSTMSDDSGRANPKMSTAIPPYNAQMDRHTKNYFEKKLVQRLLTRTQQVCIMHFPHYVKIFLFWFSDWSFFFKKILLFVCLFDLHRAENFFLSGVTTNAQLKIRLIYEHPVLLTSSGSFDFKRVTFCSLVNLVSRQKRLST